MSFHHKQAYQIKLPHFEGPFDLLLFFVERDELNIYNIPITKLINDFLSYIHEMRSIHIELASEFILFVATLMRIKAKMLIPRKEIDEEGKEIDPREELISKVLAYKQFKEIAQRLAEMEEQRIYMQKRGNMEKEFLDMEQKQTEGREIETLSLFQLMRSFERAIQKFNERIHKPIHIVETLSYSIESVRSKLFARVKEHKTLSFEMVFTEAESKLHAIFLFLSLLELVQQNLLQIMVGNTKNNFIVTYLAPNG